MITGQNNQPQPRDNRLAVPEAGRRYSPARVQPRMGTDIRRTGPGPTPSIAALQAVAPKISRENEPAHAAPTHMRDVARPTPAARKVVATKPAQPRQHKSLVLKRTITTKAEKYKKQARNERRQQLKAFVMGSAVAVLLAGVGMTLFLRNQQAANSVNIAPAPQALGVSTTQQSAPDETAVSMLAVTEHRANADEPRVLRIQRIGINARAVAVGASMKGEPEVTANIHDVGWLTASAKPGTSGTIIINGYVAGPTSPGTFAGLSTLLAGDVIQVERGDGKQFSYIVVKTQTFPADKVDMKAVSASAEAGKSGLSLVSNTGRFNVRTNKFEDRTVVWAVQN